MGQKKWCIYSQKLVYQRNASSYYFVANCMSASWNFVTNEVGINSNRTWVRHFELTFPQRGQNCRRHEDWIGQSCETREHAISFLSVFFHFFFSSWAGCKSEIMLDGSLSISSNTCPVASLICFDVCVFYDDL